MSAEVAPDSMSVAWESGRQDQCPPDLRFLHFNDVYHIEYVALAFIHLKLRMRH